MLALSRAMVSDAIAAYVARNAVAAREVIDRDDEVDRLYWKTFRGMLKDIVGDPNRVAAAISQILVARFAERIADQATNISEEVVYLVEGTPIRHMAAEHQHVKSEEDTTDGS
jgi:phosphate transport system protein